MGDREGRPPPSITNPQRSSASRRKLHVVFEDEAPYRDNQEKEEIEDQGPGAMEEGRDPREEGEGRTWKGRKKKGGALPHERLSSNPSPPRSTILLSPPTHGTQTLDTSFSLLNRRRSASQSTEEVRDEQGDAAHGSLPCSTASASSPSTLSMEKQRERSRSPSNSSSTSNRSSGSGGPSREKKRGKEGENRQKKEKAAKSRGVASSSSALSGSTKEKNSSDKKEREGRLGEGGNSDRVEKRQDARSSRPFLISPSPPPHPFYMDDDLTTATEDVSSTEEFVFKVAVVGSFHVGKTCLVHRLQEYAKVAAMLRAAESSTSSPAGSPRELSGRPRPSSTTATTGLLPSSPVPLTKPTIGVDFFTCEVGSLLPSTNIRLQLWDTAGLERYAVLPTSTFRSASLVLCVFDVTDVESLEGIANRYIPSIVEGLPGAEPGQIFVVANKIDLLEEITATSTSANNPTPSRTTMKGGTSNNSSTDTTSHPNNASMSTLELVQEQHYYTTHPGAAFLQAQPSPSSFSSVTSPSTVHRKKGGKQEHLENENEAERRGGRHVDPTSSSWPHAGLPPSSAFDSAIATTVVSKGLVENTLISAFPGLHYAEVSAKNGTGVWSLLKRMCFTLLERESTLVLPEELEDMENKWNAPHQLPSSPTTTAALLTGRKAGENCYEEGEKGEKGREAEEQTTAEEEGRGRHHMANEHVACTTTSTSDVGTGKRKEGTRGTERSAVGQSWAHPNGGRSSSPRGICFAMEPTTLPFVPPPFFSEEGEPTQKEENNGKEEGGRHTQKGVEKGGKALFSPVEGGINRVQKRRTNGGEEEEDGEDLYNQILEETGGNLGEGGEDRAEMILRNAQKENQSRQAALRALKEGKDPNEGQDMDHDGYGDGSGGWGEQGHPGSDKRNEEKEEDEAKTKAEIEAEINQRFAELKEQKRGTKEGQKGSNKNGGSVDIAARYKEERDAKREKKKKKGCC